MKMPISVAVLLGLCCEAGLAACDIESIGARLSQDNTLYDFTQQKSIAALSRPLNSSGVIWLTPQQELVWQVRSPIRSTTVISSEEVREYNRNDVLQPQIDNPVAQDLPEIFLNLLSGNFAALEASFEQTLSCDQEDWTLHLAPIQTSVSELLSSITVAGNQSLTQVTYVETRGDRTAVSLSPSNDPNPDFRRYLEN